MEKPLDERVAEAVARMRANWERYDREHDRYVDYDDLEPFDYYSDSDWEYEEEYAEDPDDEWAEIKQR